MFCAFPHAPGGERRAGSSRFRGSTGRRGCSRRKGHLPVSRLSRDCDVLGGRQVVRTRGSERVYLRQGSDTYAREAVASTSRHAWGSWGPESTWPAWVRDVRDRDELFT